MGDNDGSRRVMMGVGGWCQQYFKRECPSLAQIFEYLVPYLVVMIGGAQEIRPSQWMCVTSTILNLLSLLPACGLRSELSPFYHDGDDLLPLWNCRLKYTPLYLSCLGCCFILQQQTSNSYSTLYKLFPELLRTGWFYYKQSVSQIPDQPQETSKK